MGSIIRESARLPGQEGYRAHSIVRYLGIITSPERRRTLFLSTFRRTQLSATCRGLLARLLAVPSANIRYLPRRRRGRGSSWLFTTHACLFISPDGRVLERFGACVPHMHRVAWIQQSSCSRALLPPTVLFCNQRVFISLLPSLLYRRFGTVWLSFSLPLSPFLPVLSLPQSVIHTADSSPRGDKGDIHWCADSFRFITQGF